MDAVLTSMSCFRLLCEEAEIRCGADEMAVTQLLPNSTVYEELAAASTVLTTGKDETVSVKGCYTSSFSTGKDETVSVKGCYTSSFSTGKDGTVSVKGCYTSSFSSGKDETV